MYPKGLITWNEEELEKERENKYPIVVWAGHMPSTEEVTSICMSCPLEETGAMADEQ